MTYRIALADDEPLVKECVRKILAEEGDLKVVIDAADGSSLLDQLRQATELPDLVIVDISMPPPDGIEVTRKIRELYPKVKVLILTMYAEKDYLAPAMSAGAAGYLLKDEAGTELIPAIRFIRDGCTYVAARFRPDVDFSRPFAKVDKASGEEGLPGSKFRNAQNGGRSGEEETPLPKPPI